MIGLQAAATLVNRGTVDRHLESVLRPELSWGWLANAAAAAAIYVFWFRPEPTESSLSRPPDALD